MGTNPVAVDIVAARIMGYQIDDIGYLKLAALRGYKPSSIEEIEIRGDYNSLKDIDMLANRLKPYDDEWYRWDDVKKELKRLNSPVRLFLGPVKSVKSGETQTDCRYGCIMGLKMTLASLERYAGMMLSYSPQ